MSARRRREDAGPPREGALAPARARHRLSTRRRLVATFLVVLATFLSAFAVQIVGLRGMEVTFEAMKEHEEQLSLALQLEDAIRDQYEARQLVRHAAQKAEYEEARARVLDLTRRMTDRLDDPEERGWVVLVGEASAELDGILRAQLLSAAQDQLAVRDRSYALIKLVDENLETILTSLQQATTTFRQELAAVESAALRWTAMLLFATPLFVAGAVLYLSRSVTGPLARLSEGAAAIAAGDLDTRIDVHTNDEFGALAAEFNRMTVALKQQQARLVESEKLAVIGRLAAGIAHELNNPLQVMLGYLSLNRGLRDRRLAEHLAATEEEVLRCQAIVEGMLDLARPMGSVVEDAVDLRAVFEEVANRLRLLGLLDASRLSLEGTAVVLGDRLKLGQVAFNLMKNAAEASGPHGPVEVRIGASAGDAVEAEIRDAGPGISAEARAHVFEPFFTTKPTGSGLGLAVSRALARAHGGDIDVANGAAGGAVFTIRLRRASVSGG